MRCAAYCTAKAYDLKKLYDYTKHKGPAQLLGDVVYFRFKKGEVFSFASGCVVFWGLTEDEEKEALTLASPFQIEPIRPHESGICDFTQGEVDRVYQDMVTLKNPPDVMAKASVSYGLAQSVKLLHYERKVGHAVTSTHHIPQALAQHGHVPLSRKEIGRKIGELFLESSSINLQSDFLDPPDFFWDNPEYEPLYIMTAKDFDIKNRTLSLNRKLSMMHDLYEILGDELNNRHASKLEWIVIVLIMMEVLIGLANKWDHWFAPYLTQITA